MQIFTMQQLHDKRGLIKELFRLACVYNRTLDRKYKYTYFKMLKIQQLHDELGLIIQLFWSAYVYNKTFDQKKYNYLYFESATVS